MKDLSKFEYSNLNKVIILLSRLGKSVKNNSVGLGLETYYTINGKSPTRSKNYLYTKPFTLRRNVTGSDKVVLKTKSYCQGLQSEVRTVEFKINKKQNSLNI